LFLRPADCWAKAEFPTAAAATSGHILNADHPQKKLRGSTYRHTVAEMVSSYT
jgi:hypothetical protein